MDTLEEQKQTGKGEHTVRYIIYAAAAYFGLQYLLKPKRATAAIVTLQPATEIVVDNDNAVVMPKQPVAISNNTESFPLRKGMRGERIQALQQKLGVTADGVFGSETQSALFKQFSITSVTASQYPSIMLSKLKTLQPTNASPVLKRGSRGADVYRLQKWLGFKDTASAKQGERIADSDFGQQTENALYSKTGQRSISIAMLNQYTKK